MSDMETKNEVSEAMKEQINKIADAAERINERVQPILLEVQKAAKGWAIKHGILKSDYDEILTQYTPYFIKHGFITPKHFEEFFMWLCGCRCPDEPFGALEIKESDFTLYHQYKELKLKPRGWSEDQERERLEVMFNNSGIDFLGLSTHLKNNGLADVTADVLQTMYEHRQLPTGSKRIKWSGSGADAKEFRALMWGNADRTIFNKCFKFGKNDRLTAAHERGKSTHKNKMTSFFRK